MKPTVKEFYDDKELMAEVKEQASKGIKKENLYVISHDDDRTDRVANKVDANEPELSGSASVFKQKGDELRAKFKEMGFEQVEAADLEEKLDHGKILLMIDEN